MKVCIFIPEVQYGGAEVAASRLSRGMHKTIDQVSLVIATSTIKNENIIPEDIDVECLGSTKTIFSIRKFASYISEYKPDVVISHVNRANFVAIIAEKIADVDASVLAVDHNTLSQDKIKWPGYVKTAYYILYRVTYPYADSIAHVSHGAARDLEREINFSEDSVSVLHNPVIEEKEIKITHDIANHKWFENDCRENVILGLGRLNPQKSFSTLIKGFAQARKETNVKLIIAGKGPLEEELIDLAKDLSIYPHVDFVGYVDDPFTFMEGADLVCLSSRWEALPTVLIESMAAGTPVVSTDCPHGPSEILDNGKYGRLVDVGSPDQLAHAIQQELAAPTCQSDLQSRAAKFTIDSSVRSYLEEIETLVSDDMSP